LKIKVSSQESSIKILVDQKKSLENKCHDESLKVVRLAAENATLKSKLISEEAKYDNMVKFKDITIARLEKELEEYRLADLKCEPSVEYKKKLKKVVQGGPVKIKPKKSK
jgi:hypothetical protein